MKTFTFDTLVTINCDARNSNGDKRQHILESSVYVYVLHDTL